MTYPLHPDFPKPPYPELSPCPWCGGVNFRHDLTKHIDPSLGKPLSEAERMAIRLRKFMAQWDDPCTANPEGK